MSPAAIQNTQVTIASPPCWRLIPTEACDRFFLRRELSLGASSQQNNLYRLEHDPEVQSQTGVLDVEKIELQLFTRVFQRVAVLVLHLCPTRNSWRHGMANPVIRNLPAQPLHELRPLRPWSNEIHVPFQHAPQLGDFVQSRDAQDLAHPRNSRIVIRCPRRASIRLRVLAHGAKFVAIKI